MTQDYYETLQVHPRADADAIEAAYARLRELYDPAKLDGAADELVDLARAKRDAIERAYAVLATRSAARRMTRSRRRSSRQRRKTKDGGPRVLVLRPPSFAEHGEEPLDYRPLPPARRAERPRGFDAQPVRAPARDGARSGAPASAHGPRRLALACRWR